MPDPDAEYLTVHEVAALWRVSPRTVYRAIRAGRLAAVTIGRARRIPRSVLAPKEAA